jgi:hypothetical protein
MLTDKRVPVPDSDEFNVKHYGAAGDDSTDDTTAFTNAIAAMVALGRGTIFVPRGRYRITSALSVSVSVTDAGFGFQGEGRYASVLRFGGAATGGLAFVSSQTTSNRHPSFRVSNLGLETSKKTTGTAIDARWANANNLASPLLIENVQIGQDLTRVSDQGADFGWWTKGIYLENARNGHIYDLHMFGELNLASPTTHGIHFAKENTHFVVSGCQFLECTTACLVDQNAAGAGTSTEGLYWHNNDVVACTNGLICDITSGAEPQLTIIGGHFNTTTLGIEIEGFQQGVISGVLFYADDFPGTGPWPAYSAIKFIDADSKFWTISNCTFSKESGRTSDTTIAVDIQGGSHITIENCRAFGFGGNNFTTAVNIAAGGDRVKVINFQTDAVTNDVVNAGTNLQEIRMTDITTTVRGATDQIFEIEGQNAAFFTFRDSGAAADFKLVEWVQDGGELQIRHLNDNRTLKRTPMTIHNNGVTKWPMLATFLPTLGPWFLNDVPGTATTEMKLAYMNTATAFSQGATNFNDLYMPSAGEIVGLWIVSDVARTAGTAKVQIRKNGTATEWLSGTVVLDGTNTTRFAAFDPGGGSLGFAAGDRLGLAVVSASWTPITANFLAYLMVRMTP